MGANREERPGRYATQARTYDLTRSASPTVVRLVSKYLGPANGRRLLEIAAGTANYGRVMQARGFDLLVLDAEFEMVSRSVGKIGRGRQIVADAMALPLRARSVDCAMLVAAIHLMPDPDRAMSQARRVIRDGPFVLQAFTEENMAPIFVLEYFPGSELLNDFHPPAAEFARRLEAAGFSRIEHEKFVYLDTADGTLPALHTDALRLAGPAYLRNNSWFNRIPEDVREAGLARLAEDLRSGALEEKVKASFQEAVVTGHGIVFAAWP
ncbi:MAG TPA: class I SAM-dependent methyltransferase [Actinomycetota bacterium]